MRGLMPPHLSKERLEEIRLATPGPVARHLNKRISLPISARLAKWGVPPNWISVFNMILGLSTGFFVAGGTYSSYLSGAFLFQLASILDGCDGEVAKLNHQTSKLGEWLDSISDNGALLSFFTGLMTAFAKTHAQKTTLTTALFLILGLALLLAQIISFLKRKTQSASLVTFDKEYLSKLPLQNGSFLMTFVRYGRILMRKDCFSLFFFIFALLGILPVWIYIAVAGTWMANGTLLWLKIKPKKSLSLTSTGP